MPMRICTSGAADVAGPPAQAGSLLIPSGETTLTLRAAVKAGFEREVRW